MLNRFLRFNARLRQLVSLFFFTCNVIASDLGYFILTGVLLVYKIFLLSVERGISVIHILPTSLRLLGMTFNWGIICGIIFVSFWRRLFCFQQWMTAPTMFLSNLLLRWYCVRFFSWVYMEYTMMTLQIICWLYNN